MPGLNQKGPMGQGPMTGRRMGRCTNFGAKQKKTILVPEENEGIENEQDCLPENNPEAIQCPGRGRGGIGRGMGLGRGMGQQNRFRGKN